ncbi:PAS domain-containing protein [Rhizobium cauense]|uniref:PAS domain-containing sensor histidine kinase n=1 Tax=Rhizobium cauense TaxID=1166683 RepID=UPI001C6F3962|nr:PAS domain-containing protein [Rhizobium cauense]MBW9116826.1 PAS domain-containing protein [Rhizobium cauense]
MLNNISHHLGTGILILSALMAAIFTVADVALAQNHWISAFAANAWKLFSFAFVVILYDYTGKRCAGADNCLDRRCVMSADTHHVEKAEETLRAREQELADLSETLARETAERTKAEAAGRQVGRDLEAMLSNIPVLVLMMDPAGRVLFTNGYWIQDGYESAESLIAQLNTDPSVFHHPEDYVTMLERRKSSIAEGSNYYLEHRVRRPDGLFRWFLTRTTVAKDDEGNVVKRYLTSIDIDDRKKAEEALAARERELQLLIDTVPTPIWSLTPDGSISYLNRRFEADFGRTVDGAELQPMGWNEVHPDEKQTAMESLAHSLQTGEPYAMRYRRHTHSGVYRWVDVRAEPLRDEDGRIVRWYGATIDIDDEIRAQEALNAARERLSRASQLATVSELSASIAHELNQPLAAAVTGSEASQRWLLTEPPNIERARATLDRVVRNARSAAEVVGRIHALFTQDTIPRSPTNLNEVIAEVLELMNDLIVSEGVVLEVRLEALPTLLVDGVQIQQVMVNLIRNAIDAMKPLLGQTKSLLIASRPFGKDGAIVEVHDVGEGISNPDRIFEAFFTTKPDGKGLGLAICRSIIDAHGGRLWAELTGARGTVVSFTLPGLDGMSEGAGDQSELFSEGG